MKRDHQTMGQSDNRKEIGRENAQKVQGVVDEAVCVPMLALISVVYAHAFGAALAYGLAGSLAFWSEFGLLVVATLNLVWIRWIMRRAAVATHEEGT